MRIGVKSLAARRRCCSYHSRLQDQRPTRDSYNILQVETQSRDTDQIPLHVGSGAGLEHVGRGDVHPGSEELF
jgi:hypothetical protein